MSVFPVIVVSTTCVFIQQHCRSTPGLGINARKANINPQYAFHRQFSLFPCIFSQACSPSDNVAIRIAKLMIVCKSLSTFFIEKNVSALGAYTTL